MIKAKPDSLSMLNGIEGQDHQSYNHDMALSTNNFRLLQRKRKMVDTDAEVEAHTQSRTRKNWFHLHIWPAIDQAARKINFSPRETVSYLQSRHKNTSIYDTFSPSTVHNWIDRTRPKREWTERISTLVANGTCWTVERNYKSILDGHPELIIDIRASLSAI